MKNTKINKLETVNKCEVTPLSSMFRHQFFTGFYRNCVATLTYEQYYDIM